MAKTTACKHCGKEVDNRGIKHHEVNCAQQHGLLNGQPAAEPEKAKKAKKAKSKKGKARKVKPLRSKDLVIEVNDGTGHEIEVGLKLRLKVQVEIVNA